MATWTALIKHHIEDRTLNWRHVYHVLELEDPDAFCARRVDENRKSLRPDHLFRQTGRSTRLAARAIAHIYNGGLVFMKGPQPDMEKVLLRNTRELLVRFQAQLRDVPLPRGYIFAAHQVGEKKGNQSYLVLVDDY